MANGVRKRYMECMGDELTRKQVDKDSRENAFSLVNSSTCSLVNYLCNVNRKEIPLPRMLFADICPLWKITAFLTIDKPNPVPPNLRLRPVSTR